MPDPRISPSLPSSSELALPEITDTIPRNPDPMVDTNVAMREMHHAIDGRYRIDLDPQALEHQLGLELAQTDLLVKIKKTQLLWSQRFIAALKQDYPQDDLQLKLMRFAELTVLLNHPGFIRMETTSSIWSSLESYLRRSAPDFISALSQKIRINDAVVKAFSIYRMEDVAYLWETLVSSIWLTSTDDTIEFERWSTAIKNADMLLLVLQLNIHRVFDIDDIHLLSLLKPVLENILPEPQAFIDKLISQYNADVSVELLRRLFHDTLHQPTLSSGLPSSSMSPNLPFSPHTSYLSFGSSDPESCSDSEETFLPQLDDEKMLQQVIGTVHHLSKLMQGLSLEHRLNLFNSIIRHVASIIHAPNDVRLLFSLLPNNYWPKFLYYAGNKYISLLSSNVDIALMIEDFLNEILRKTGDAQAYLMLPPLSSSANPFDVNANSTASYASYFLSAEDDDQYLKEFIVETLKQKTGDDVDGILSILPSEHHRHLIMILYKSMPTCTAAQLAKLMNRFRDDVGFILEAFSRDELIAIVSNKGLFVILESVYARSASFFIRHINELMGREIGHLFSDSFTLKKTLSLMGGYKLNFIELIKDNLESLLLRTSDKHISLIQFLNMFEKNERPQVINLFSEIMPQLFSKHYSLRLISDKPEDKKIEHGEIYFDAHAGYLRYVIKLPGGDVVRSSLDIEIKGELTPSTLANLRQAILAELFRREDIISHKGVNATHYGAVLKLLPVEYYKAFTTLVEKVIGYIFEDEKDLITVLNIVPQAYRAHFLNIEVIDTQMQYLLRKVLETEKKSGGNNGHTARFFAGMMASLTLHDVTQVSDFLLRHGRAYSQWLMNATEVYDAVVSSKSTPSTLLERSLRSVLPSTSSKLMQQWDILNRPVYSLRTIIHAFINKTRRDRYVLSEGEVKTAKAILTALNNESCKILSDVMQLLSETIHNSKPNSFMWLAFLHVLKSKASELLQSQATIRFTLPTLGGGLLPLQGSDLKVYQEQFCIDVKRCYQIAIKEGGERTVLIDTGPKLYSRKDDKTDANIFHQLSTFVSGIFSHGQNVDDLSHFKEEESNEIKDEDIINSIEQANIPQAFRALIYQCNQNGYVNFFIKEILSLFREIGILLTKDRKYENSDESMRIITFNRLEEILVFEERYYVNLFAMDGEEPQTLGEPSYIKTIQTFDINGHYHCDPAVTLHLPKLILQRVEQACIAKSASVGSLTPLEQCLLSELRPVAMPEAKYWSGSSMSTHFTSSSSRSMSTHSSASSSSSVPVSSMSTASSLFTAGSLSTAGGLSTESSLSTAGSLSTMGSSSTAGSLSTAIHFG